jgi:hypothetical protein
MVAYVAYIYTAVAVIWCVWYGIAALIITRKPDDRGAVVSAFFLILFPAIIGAVLLPPNAPTLIGAVLTLPGICLLIPFCLLFPDGRFRPRWTRWLAVAGILITIPAVTPSSPLKWAEPAWLLVLLTCVGVQVYRYRTVSSWEQRQQSKWALFGLAVAIVGFVAILLTYAFPWGYNGTVYAGFSTTLISGVPTAIPITIGIAMLRSRLWDIDRVVNRALVYLALTGALASIYILSILALDALFGLVVGGSSKLVIALSTLGTAALFGPMRRSIQTGIDRRFYRDKYDAERTLARAGARLRDEVDMSELSGELTAVVRDTLHPAHVSLWVRPE